MFLLQNSFPGSKHDDNYYQPTVNTIHPQVLIEETEEEKV